MARKNPENNSVEPTGAAAARSRRSTPVARPKHSPTKTEMLGGKPPATGPEGARSADQKPAHEEIARLAYLYWEARGRQGGCPEEDWLRAEQELCRSSFAATVA
jgi:DUF2934 family protein